MREEVKEDGAEGNIWTHEGGSERRIVLGGIFGTKREEVKGGWCCGEYLDPRGRK